MRTLAVLIYLVVILAVPACADMYTLSVPGVAGNYQDSASGPASMTTAFDFGQSFSQIDMVDISLSGYMLSGQSQDPDWSTSLLGGRFDITIADANGTPGIYGQIDYQAETWDGRPLSSFDFNDWLMTGGTPGTLLSGRGFITVNFSTETNLYTTQYSSPDIYDLSIIVNGTTAPTPVPEPSTMVAGIACLAPFLLRRRK